MLNVQAVPSVVVLIVNVKHRSPSLVFAPEFIFRERPGDKQTIVSPPVALIFWGTMSRLGVSRGARRHSSIGLHLATCVEGITGLLLAKGAQPPKKI